MPVQVGRSIGPPHLAALAQLPLCVVDRVMCRRFRSAVASGFGGFDGPAGCHKVADACSHHCGRKMRIGQPPKPASNDKIATVGGHGMLETGHQMNGLPPVTATVVPEV